MQSNIDGYLESWTMELYARADRVRQLIGDAHWLSDGHHKESIIREFLQRYMPNNFTVSRGFIRSVSSNVCSPEIDILISNYAIHPPFFFEGDLQIIPPSSVVAHIEVKTAFNRTNLDSSIENILSAKKILNKYGAIEKTWSSIFFFDIPDTRTPESILKTMRDSLESAEVKIKEEGDYSICDLLPTCLVVFSRYIIFVRKKSDSEVDLCLFELNKYSFPCAIADLFGVMRLVSGGPLIGELDDIIEGLADAAPIICKINF